MRRVGRGFGRISGLLLASFLAVGSSSEVLARSPASQEAGQAPKPATLAISQLPDEGQRTYRLILQGGPFPYEKDGSIFGNRERLLPLQQRGFYREYTVATPQARERGARRIVCGGPQRAPEVCYYTADHYASFQRLDQAAQPSQAARASR